DEQRHSTDFGRRKQTSSPRRQDELPPQTSVLDRAIHGQSPEPEDRNVMPGQAFPNDLRCSGILKRCRTEAIEAKDRLAIRIGNGQESLGGAFFMTLASVPSQKLVQFRFTAIERGAVVFLTDRLFAPVER